MADNIRIRAMGSFSIEVNGVFHEDLTIRSRKGVTLLLYLILERGKAVSTQRIIREIWGSKHSYSPENALKTRVSRVRALLNELSDGLGDCIVSTSGGYRWQSGENVTVDVLEVMDLFDCLRRDCSPEERREKTERLLELYQGDLFSTGEARNDVVMVNFLHREYLDAVFKYVAQLRSSGAMEREAQRWPIWGKDFDTEVERMHQWLEQRADFMTGLIANIPVPDTTAVSGQRLCGTISTTVTMDRARGYDQSVKVSVSKSKVLALMGLEESQFSEPNVSIIPLYNDGTEGPNNTNGAFGGWFDEDGEPYDWGHGHVYIEVFSDLWNWNCGVHPKNCWDDEHTVVMQYQYPHEGTLLKVNIEVNFKIDDNGWWW